jgi:energy-coupling factor transporter ATP-binding protein EcfA2
VTGVSDRLPPDRRPSDRRPSDRPGSDRSAANDPDPVVSVRDVGYRYEGAAQDAITGVGLELASRSVVGLAGANGSGKTTLAKLVAGLLRPRSGVVILDGLDTRAHGVRELAAHAGFAFQNPGHQLFAPTVARELAFGPRNLGVGEPEVGRRTAEVADMLELRGVLDEHPRRLGLAQRKLVAIGSVLTMRPRLLVLDEPTTGQDPRVARHLVRLIGRLREAGAGILIVAHDMAFLAEVADRLLILDAGRLIADAPPRSVFADTALTERAGVVPPQITRLSLRLPTREPADRVPALTVDELVAGLGWRGTTDHEVRA